MLELLELLAKQEMEIAIFKNEMALIEEFMEHNFSLKARIKGDKIVFKDEYSSLKIKQVKPCENGEPCFKIIFKAFNYEHDKEKFYANLTNLNHIVRGIMRNHM